LPGKLSGGTHREADGEEDHVTAGGGIRSALYSCRTTPGRRWNARDREDWRSFVSGLCSEME